VLGQPNRCLIFYVKVSHGLPSNDVHSRGLEKVSSNVFRRLSSRVAGLINFRVCALGHVVPLFLGFWKRVSHFWQEGVAPGRETHSRRLRLRVSY